MIGERVNCRSMADAEVRRCEVLWRKNPVHHIRHYPGMTRGRSRERLLDITSIKPQRVKIVNLLPPSNECGGWDRRLAEYCSVHLLSWLAHGCNPDRWERIIMLGKRISCELTDRRRCEFGEVYDLCGVPALCFPHPSGRSRYLNELDYQAKARLWARKFLRGVK